MIQVGDIITKTFNLPCKDLLGNEYKQRYVFKKYIVICPTTFFLRGYEMNEKDNWYQQRNML